MSKNTPPIFGRLRRTKRREELTMVKRVTKDAHVYNRFEIRPFFWDALVFLGMTFVLCSIAFLGRPPHAPIVQLHQRPKFTFEAPFEFHYDSDIARNDRRAVARALVLPVFRLDNERLESRVRGYREFAKEVAASREILMPLTEEDRENRILAMPTLREIPGPSRMIAHAASVAVETAGSAAYFETVFNEALQNYDDLCRRGLYDESTFKSVGASVVNMLGRDSRHRELSVIEARRLLFNNTYYPVAGDAGSGRTEQDNARRFARAVVDILQPSLGANIVMDMAATQQARDTASAAEPPVPVVVKSGTPLIQRDIEVGDDTLERWRAFRIENAKRESVDFGLTRSFLVNTLSGVAFMALVLMYSRVAAPPGPRRKRAMSLVAITVSLNLLLLRGTLAFAESGFATHVAEALQWAAPWALAPLIVAVLAGPHMAIVAAILVSGFSAAMNGNSPQVQLAALLSALVAVRFVKGVRLRGRIVTAGLVSAVPVALIAFYDNASAEDWMRPETLTIPLAALGAGLFTGVVATGLVPFFENLFKTTTDITLLELTDYNHPLLRKLQILAPGTFHHSVMVANIAERAAEDIGANALYCRCASLFHDIGKMAKPEYFIENQRAGSEPHADIAPSMSALVIKSHVREGVEIAREYRLPKVIIDIIEQHHGTGLIRFFFHKACKAAESGEICSRLAAAGVDAPVVAQAVERAVDESLFRYDGPKPRTREAAIILLADSVEAASRSLKKVTRQTVEDLVDAIVTDRIADGQFDECPLTFREVRKLRESLKKSLLTSLHTRVEYPAEPSKASLTKAPFKKPEIRV